MDNEVKNEINAANFTNLHLPSLKKLFWEYTSENSVQCEDIRELVKLDCEINKICKEMSVVDLKSRKRIK